MYTMMQVCRELDMTYQTLKFYCNEGLVPNVKRDKNNRRIFDEKDVKWIHDLSCLKKCGMSIQEMKEYLALCLEGESTIKARKEMLDKKQSRKFSDTDHRGATDVNLVVKNMEAAWKLPGGIYNYGSSNDADMYETVRRVMASFGQEALVEKATGGNVRNLMMSTDKLAQHGIFFPDTAAGLEAFLRKGGAL